MNDELITEEYFNKICEEDGYDGRYLISQDVWIEFNTINSWLTIETSRDSNVMHTIKTCNQLNNLIRAFKGIL